MLFIAQQQKKAKIITFGCHPWPDFKFSACLWPNHFSTKLNTLYLSIYFEKKSKKINNFKKYSQKII